MLAVILTIKSYFLRNSESIRICTIAHQYVIICDDMLYLSVGKKKNIRGC